ncbi:MAG: site-2 protease family protein [Clostridiales bacterium]|nr:site-2 protease family protein [Clostridiales bacterium]
MSQVFANLDWSVATTVLMRVIPALFCLTIHELSHGYVAYRLGDSTAKDMGRLTLNPVRHIDPMGLVMMAVFRFGWAKPVPVNMGNFEKPKRGMALTALAGPVSNFILAAVILAIYGFLYAFMPGDFGTGWRTAMEIIYTIALLSVFLGVFNLIPLPPLDGSKVLFGLILTDAAYYRLMRIERYGMIIMMAIIWSGLLTGALNNATMWIFGKLFHISEGVYKIVSPMVS